ncbi:MAG: hypothetical protein JST87_11985 [Bacteroidetes bacterium]|nr:hypothetical protein [Bacteroidota bacterium]
MATVNLGATTNMRTEFNLGDALSTKIDFTIANDPHIKGSPFFVDTFSHSMIILKNGVGYNGVETRINLATNNIYFKTSDSTELVASKPYIKKLYLFNTTKSGNIDTVVFSLGYPPVEHNDETTLYQELTSGRAVFLKFTSKKLVEQNSPTATAMDKQYIALTTYYVFAYNNGHPHMEKWNKGKDFLLGFLYDKKEAVQKFINDLNLKCKSPEDATRVFNYYNNL